MDKLSNPVHRHRTYAVIVLTLWKGDFGPKSEEQRARNDAVAVARRRRRQTEATPNETAQAEPEARRRRTQARRKKARAAKQTASISLPQPHTSFARTVDDAPGESEASDYDSNLEAPKVDPNIDPQLLAPTSTPRQEENSPITPITPLDDCDDEEILAAARAWFSAFTSSAQNTDPDVLILVARYSESDSPDVLQSQLDHLLKLFEDWRRRFDSGSREWVTVKRHTMTNTFPTTAELLQYLVDGKRIVFFLTLGICTAKSMFLGEFALTSDTSIYLPTSKAEQTVIHLLDALRERHLSAMRQSS